MRSVFFYCLTLGIFYQTVAFAAIPAEADMAVYRFYSSPNSQSSHVALYKQGLENRFHPRWSGRLKIGGRCESLLGMLQTFPLEIMREVGHVNDAEFVEEMAKIDHLEASQFTFIEMARSKKPEALDAAEKMRTSPLREQTDLTLTRTQKASLWIVAGQVYSPNRAEANLHPQPPSTVEFKWDAPIRIEPKAAHFDPHEVVLNVTALPWQKHPENFDRKKFPLIYELGRAAQVDPDYLETMIQAATGIIYQEISTGFQAQDKDVYVFLQAFSPSRVRLFKRMGFEVFEEGSRGDQKVMVANFAELCRRYPPAQLSSRVQAIKNLVPKITDNRFALNMLTRNTTNFTAALDFVWKPAGLVQTGPLVMRDFSPNAQLLNRLALQTMGGLSQDEALNHLKALDTMRNPYSLNGEYVFDDPVQQLNVERARRERWVVLTNLDPRLCRSPEYLPLVVTGTYDYLVHRYDDWHVLSPENVVAEVGTQLVIRTRFRELAEAARRAGSQSSFENGIYTEVFSPFAIKLLKARYHDRNPFDEAAPVNQGYWFFRAINADPVKF